MSPKALFIGNSDGIGLGTTKALLQQGWQVVGLSRSPSPIDDPVYTHLLVEVQSDAYVATLHHLLEQHWPLDLCLYCAGIGELLDLSTMTAEVEIFEVNVLGLVKTASCVIPRMVQAGRGHFIGLSSIGDELLSAEAPSYHASKAAFSNYLEGLALALIPHGVQITNIRFGFVETKMAKGDVKPFIMGVDRAVKHVLTCIKKRPIRYTAPWIVIPLVRFRQWMLRLQTIFR